MTAFVVVGGLSHEREAPLRFGKHLAGVLRKRSHVVAGIDVSTDLIFRLLGDEGLIAIPVPHGELSEDGALREVLWMLGVPFVNSGGVSSQRAFDRSVAIRLTGAAGLATPQQVIPPDDVLRELDVQAMMSALGERIGFPPVVKPARSGSVLGTAETDSADGLLTAPVGAFAYGRDVVVKEFIGDAELSVTILEDGIGPHALSPIETRPASRAYDCEFRYTVRAARFLTLGELLGDVLGAAGGLAVRAHRMLGHRGISRTNMTVCEDVPVFLRGNVAPGLTDTSLTPLTLETAGLDMGEVFSVLVERTRHRGH